MKLPQRKTVIKYGITITVAAFLGWMYLAIQKSEYGAFLDRAPIDQLRLLCDTFTIPGLMLMLSGLLVMVTNEGSLNGVKYLGHYMYHMFVPGKRDSTKRYADFVEEQSGKRVTGFGFLFVVGAACLAIALIFYILYKLHG